MLEVLLGPHTEGRNAIVVWSYGKRTLSNRNLEGESTKHVCMWGTPYDSPDPFVGAERANHARRCWDLTSRDLDGLLFLLFLLCDGLIGRFELIAMLYRFGACRHHGLHSRQGRPAQADRDRAPQMRGEAGAATSTLFGGALLCCFCFCFFGGGILFGATLPHTHRDIR